MFICPGFAGIHLASSGGALDPPPVSARNQKSTLQGRLG
jgi:hypothetical protein